MDYCTQMSTCTQLEADGSITTVERPCRNLSDGPINPFAPDSKNRVCRLHRAAINPDQSITLSPSTDEESK